METSLYSVDFACSSNHLMWHEYSSHEPQVARVPGEADFWHWLPTPAPPPFPEYTILDGDATKISCTKCETNIIDIKRKRFNSQQFRSSSPSLQSRSPLHRQLNAMHWPLLHRNHPSGQVFDAKRYNIINYQWFCAYTYRINLIQMVSVIEFTRI